MLTLFLNSHVKKLAKLLQAYHDVFIRTGDSVDYSNAHYDVLEYGRKLYNRGGKKLMHKVHSMISKGKFPGAEKCDIRLFKKHLERSWDSFTDWRDM